MNGTGLQDIEQSRQLTGTGPEVQRGPHPRDPPARAPGRRWRHVPAAGPSSPAPRSAWTEAARVKVGLSSCSPSGRQGNEELSGENERDQARDIGRYGNGRSASCPPQRRSRAAPPPPRPPAPGVAHAWSERKRPGKQVSRPAAGSARAQGAVQARSPGGGQRGRQGDRPPHSALGKRLPAPCWGPAPGCLERPTRPRP